MENSINYIFLSCYHYMPNFYKLNKYLFPQMKCSYADEIVNTDNTDETNNCKITVK